MIDGPETKAASLEGGTENTRPSSSEICIVTVTYGNRIDLLERSIACAADAGVEKWIVVCNGIDQAAENQLRNLISQLGRNITIFRKPTNTGSAGGYAQGIKAAMADPEINFVWLMDDDNGARPDALGALIDSFENQLDTYSRDKLGLMSLRSDRQAFVDVANGIKSRSLSPRPHSIFGFHVLFTPMRILARVSTRIVSRCVGVRPRSKRTLGEICLEIPLAPYSGMFLSRRLLEKIGLPDEKFVLYADDTEFSSRIIKTGGRLLLVPESIVDDLEPSWHRVATQRTSFGKLLSATSAFRIYYSARNEVYMARMLANNRILFFINRTLFLCILWFFSIIYGRKKEFKIIRKAFEDGVAGRLGLCSEFPLP